MKMQSPIRTRMIRHEMFMGKAIKIFEKSHNTTYGVSFSSLEIVAS